MKETISFVSFIHARFDKRHDFQPDFVDQHIRVSSGIKSDIETLYHLHQRELVRKNIIDWLEAICTRFQCQPFA